MMQRPPYVPKLHSSHMRTSVAGRTSESQIGLLPLVSAQVIKTTREAERGRRGDSPFAIALFAQTTDCDARELSAQDQIRMMSERNCRRSAHGLSCDEF